MTLSWWVRLSQADKRRIKGLAATQGLTLRRAILQAFDAWAEKLQSEGVAPLGPGPSARADAGFGKPGRPNRTGKREPDQRRTEAGPSATSGGGQAANPQAAPVQWLRRAAQVDWSKCPAAESVPGQPGVWVVRGTRVHLDAIFDALDHGQPPEEVLEASGLTREQFLAVLQFVAASVGVFPATR